MTTTSYNLRASPGRTLGAGALAARRPLRGRGRRRRACCRPRGAAGCLLAQPLDAPKGDSGPAAEWCVCVCFSRVREQHASDRRPATAGGNRMQRQQRARMQRQLRASAGVRALRPSIGAHLNMAHTASAIALLALRSMGRDLNSACAWLRWLWCACVCATLALAWPF